MPNRYFSKYTPWILTSIFLIALILSVFYANGEKSGWSQISLSEACTTRIVGLNRFDTLLRDEVEEYDYRLRLSKKQDVGPHSGTIPKSWFKTVNGKLVAITPPDTTSHTVRLFFDEYGTIHAQCGRGYDDPYAGTFKADMEGMKLSQFDMSKGTTVLDPVIDFAESSASFTNLRNK